MRYFLIGYDLHHTDSYPQVWSVLEEWGATRVLESLWVVTSNASADRLLSAFEAILEKDDSALIVELKPGASWETQGAILNGVRWLRANLSDLSDARSFPV